MPSIICTATLQDRRQIDNLSLCVEILGGKPCIEGSRVSVEYEGDEEKVDQFAKLFEQYSRHGICITP